MKRIFLLLVLTVTLLFVGCEGSSCTECGHDANEHIASSYINSDGQTVYVSGYANSSGCITFTECSSLP